MNPFLSKRCAAFVAVVALTACGGGGDGSTPPPTVASVLISSPAAPPTIGTLGRTVQFAAQAKDASGGVVAGAVITWGSSDQTVATVGAATGLLTAVANGTTQITATSNSHASPMVTVTVAQVPATVTVTSTSAVPDILFATGRTLQYSAAVKDTLNNAIAAPVVAWTSTVTTVATVNGASGLAAAVADGSTSIRATAGTAVGNRTLVIRRLAATHSISPGSAPISTASGTQLFTGTAADSAATALPMTWLSRNSGVVTVTPASGTSTIATATGNGTTRVVLSVAAGPVDSATVTTTNQAAVPTTASVTIGDDFFRSDRNASTNTAVDTIAAGGTVTWNWTGSLPHSVLSTGSPSFTSSTNPLTGQTTGTYPLIFNTVGNYTYICGVHGAIMSGTIVVR